MRNMLFLNHILIIFQLLSGISLLSSLASV